MKYTKKAQTKKPKITSKVCTKCGRKRRIDKFEKPTSHICLECKRKAKRLKKRSSKTYIKKQEDTRWSKEVKRIAGFKCEYCGKTTNLNSHHIFGRTNLAVRHDTDNGVCLCAGHHTFNTKFSAHQTPTIFTEWIIKKRGVEWYKKLEKKAVGIKK